MVQADKILSEQQLTKLIKRLKSEKDKSIANMQSNGKTNVVDARIVLDYFVLSLIANTGLRISEALKLKWDDIHDDFLIVRAENSKNGKKGTVYFGPKTNLLINELRQLKFSLLKKTSTDLLFSFSGKLPSRSYLHARFKYWLIQCELPNSFSVHSLRHSFATYALNKGLSLTFVRDQLRHSNITVTSRYLHLTKENRDKIKDLF